MIPFIKLEAVQGSLIVKLKRIDWVGSVMFAGSATSFMMGTSVGVFSSQHSLSKGSLY